MMSKTSRILVLAASALLLAASLFPLWHITLHAPQYPEGLGMRIRINTVTGATPSDLDNINELNHYIGMKVISSDAIPELRFMPWILGALVAGGLLVALAARRRWLYVWAAAFAVAALAGLADFWRWLYDYGHHIDFEHAIIKIPGMSYEPPIIGSKQLLNFTAVSWPGVGGWAALVAAVLAAVAVYLAVRATPRRTHAARVVVPSVARG